MENKKLKGSVIIILCMGIMLSLSTGVMGVNVLWKYYAPGGAAIYVNDDGIVIAGVEEYTVYADKSRTPSSYVIYIVDINGDKIVERGVTGEISDVCISANNAVAGASDSRIYFFGKNEKGIWAFKKTYYAGSSTASVYIGEKYAVAGLTNGDVRIFDIDGNLKSSAKVEGVKSVMLSDDEKLVLTASDNNLCLLDVSGDKRWCKDMQGIETMDMDDMIVVGSGKGVTLLDLDGNVKWDHKTENTPVSVRISDEGIIAGGGRTVYLFDHTGGLKWMQDEKALFCEKWIGDIFNRTDFTCINATPHGSVLWVNFWGDKYVITDTTNAFNYLFDVGDGDIVYRGWYGKDVYFSKVQDNGVYEADFDNDNLYSVVSIGLVRAKYKISIVEEELIEAKRAVAFVDEENIPHTIDLDLVEKELDKAKDAKSNGDYYGAVTLAINADKLLNNELSDELSSVKTLIDDAAESGLDTVAARHELVNLAMGNIDDTYEYVTHMIIARDKIYDEIEDLISRNAEYMNEIKYQKHENGSPVIDEKTNMPKKLVGETELAMAEAEIKKANDSWNNGDYISAVKYGVNAEKTLDNSVIDYIEGEISKNKVELNNIKKMGGSFFGSTYVKEAEMHIYEAERSVEMVLETDEFSHITKAVDSLDKINKNVESAKIVTDASVLIIAGGFVMLSFMVLTIILKPAWPKGKR